MDLITQDTGVSIGILISVVGVVGGVARAATASKFYISPIGQLSVSTTEANKSFSTIAAPFSCIVQGLKVRVMSNTMMGSSTISTEINDITGNQTITIPAGVTGMLSASSFDTLQNGDRLTYFFTGGTSGSLTLSVASAIIEPFESILSDETVNKRIFVLDDDTATIYLIESDGTVVHSFPSPIAASSDPYNIVWVPEIGKCLITAAQSGIVFLVNPNQ